MELRRSRIDQTPPSNSSYPRSQARRRGRRKSAWYTLFAHARNYRKGRVIDNIYRRWMWNGMRLRVVYGDLMIQSLPRSGRPKLSCTRDTLSVLGHANAVIARSYYFRGLLSTYSTDSRLQEVYTSLVTQRIHPRIRGALYYNLCVRLSLEMFCFEPDVGLIQM